jgi:hypothetical protein
MPRSFRPDYYGPIDILELLKAGKTLKHVAMTDRRFLSQYRLAMRFTECGPNNVVKMAYETMRREINAVDRDEVRAAIRWLDRLFQRRDTRDGAEFRRRPVPPAVLKRFEAADARRVVDEEDEPRHQFDDFKRWAMWTVGAEFALLWVLGDILCRGGPSPHSFSAFSRDTGRSRPTVCGCLGDLIRGGYAIGFKRRHRLPTLWVRPDNEDVLYNLEDKRDYDFIIGTYLPEGARSRAEEAYIRREDYDPDVLKREEARRQRLTG